MVAIQTSIPNSSNLSHHSDISLRESRSRAVPSSAGEDCSEDTKSCILNTRFCDLLPRKRLYCLAHSWFGALDHRSRDDGNGTRVYPYRHSVWRPSAWTTGIPESNSIPYSRQYDLCCMLKTMESLSLSMNSGRTSWYFPLAPNSSAFGEYREKFRGVTHNQRVCIVVFLYPDHPRSVNFNLIIT